MKTKTSRILAVVLIFQLLAFSACAGWLIYDAKVDRSGWAEKDGVRFYRDFHAKPVTGWLDIDGQRYFFLEGGIPATGWLEQDGVTRYFGSDGVMLTGWRPLTTKPTALTATGAMLTGWQQPGRRALATSPMAFSPRAGRRSTESGTISATTAKCRPASQTSAGTFTILTKAVSP